MHEFSPLILTTYALVLLFATVGTIQLAGVAVIKAIYLRLGYPPKAYRLTGAVELLAACLLALPGLRPLGVATAAGVNFIVVALLLKNRKYLLASPGVLVMAALPLVFLMVR